MAHSWSYNPKAKKLAISAVEKFKEKKCSNHGNKFCEEEKGVLIMKIH